MARQKLKIYLDTSVISALLDERQVERKRSTETFWNGMGQYEVCISGLVIKEIEAHPDQAKRVKLLNAVKSFAALDSSRDGVRALSEQYVLAEVIPATHIEDAVHLAIASVHEMDILVSWNYKHLVKLETVKKIQSFNILKGYRTIEIVTPLSL